MSFGEIFDKSWNDYKINFKPIFMIMLLFYAIPWIIVFLVAYLYPQDSSIQFLITIAFMLVSAYGTASLIKASYKNKKFTFDEAVKSIKGRYWAYIVFSIVISLYLIGLFILLIVPGVIFTIYWIFSSYVFLGENKGIHDSLRQSKKVVKGNWGKVFGYGLLLLLIYLIASIVIGLIIPPYEIGIPSSSTGEDIEYKFSFANLIISFFFTPFIIYFGKNFYFKLKKKRK